ncbi:ArsR/SmtB family transcription factor [Agromyces laixinhei]|uniref:ArsR/SmtB family transcription factor n=1 Tax=Agromyces laixinhei TaxID=2585717 RepID=UPI0012EDFBEB|nr:helix-turn-helix domain-containing protein [Agromyces laixinhei]
MNDRARPPLEEIGPVIGEPARLRILHELLGGVVLPAGALAARVGLAPSTTSAHLARLHAAGLIEIEQQGRARLARLSDPLVAEAVEALLRLTGEAPVGTLTSFDRRAAMREARSCYDHLAGRLGVAFTDLAFTHGWVTDHDGIWSMPDDAPVALEHATGLNLAWPASSRPPVRPCFDWTERRPHLAGKLGKALLDGMLANGWLRRRRSDRALTVTEAGEEQFAAVGIV